MSPSNCPFFNTPKCRKANQDCSRCDKQDEEVKNIIDFNQKNSEYQNQHKIIFK